MFIATALLTSCADDLPTEQPVEQATCGNPSASQQALYGESTVFWDKKKVSVCWLHADSVTPAHKELVKKSVTNGWDRHIDLDFVWTDQCTGCEDVFVDGIDQRPRAFIGKRRTVPFGLGYYVTLNFDFGNWGKWCVGSPEMENACIEYEATHEFGHVLGFLHEQNRPDTPQWCIGGLGEQDGMTGDFTYGVWDSQSIMNYCAPNNVVSPSENDIKGAVEIYGQETNQ